MKCCPICSRCGEVVETVEHVMFECRFAQICWAIAPVSWEGLKLHTQSFQLWWSELLMAQRGECWEERIELTAYIFWRIWKARNAVHFNREETDAWEVIKNAELEWHEFQHAMAQKEVRRVSTILHNSSVDWVKPEQGWMRVKICSESGNDLRSGAVGITAMDDTGMVTHAWAVSREISLSPVAADLDAIRCAFLLAQQHGWRRLEVKLNVKAIVYALQKGSSPKLAL